MMKFDTTPFRFSHGKEPRGRGSWAFSYSRSPEPNEVHFSPSMTYTEAKKWFKKNHGGWPTGEFRVVYVQP